jgi:hypothetical protein
MMNQLAMPQKVGNQVLMEGDSIKLNAQVTVNASGGGKPPAALPSDLVCKWTTGSGTPLQESSRVQMQQSSSGQFSLTVSGSTTADAGNYTAEVCVLFFFVNYYNL